jgi:hypothetical protein
LWRVEVEDAADGVPEAVDGALGGFAEVSFQLRESFLDWVEVGAVGREEAKLGASGFDVTWSRIFGQGVKLIPT